MTPESDRDTTVASAPVSALAILGHELRNLMTPVRARAQRAIKDGATERTIDGALHAAVEASEQAVLLAEWLLDAESLAAVVIEHETVPLLEVLASLEHVVPVSESVRLKIENDVDHGLMVPAKPTLHALLNVVQNAIRAIEGSGITGEVRVLVDRATDCSTWNTKLLRITIEDTGPGFDSLRLEVNSLGRGLGLRITRQLINGIGGHVRVADRTDQTGTTVTINMPYNIQTNESTADHAKGRSAA